jgi:hypothetical protein
VKLLFGLDIELQFEPGKIGRRTRKPVHDWEIVSSIVGVFVQCGVFQILDKVCTAARKGHQVGNWWQWYHVEAEGLWRGQPRGQVERSGSVLLLFICALTMVIKAKEEQARVEYADVVNVLCQALEAICRFQ